MNSPANTPCSRIASEVNPVSAANLGPERASAVAPSGCEDLSVETPSVIDSDSTGAGFAVPLKTMQRRP
jgi:hypothetical protein